MKIETAIVIFLVQVVFFAVVQWTVFRLTLAQLKVDQERENAVLRKDINGIGAAMRDEKGSAERRWKHLVAAQILAAKTLDEAKVFADLLRQDAYRG